jgi:hypothetical protein
MKTIKIDYINSIPADFIGVAEYPDGTKIWYKEGKEHRIDGPAIEYPDGTKEWYKEGKLHCLDRPAREYPDGEKYWYKEGELHRLDGPAVDYSDGKQYWYIEDNHYSSEKLSELIKTSFFLGKEKGRYNIEWLRFLTENGIEEFPIISGMKEYKDFKKIFNKLKRIENK